jgi:LysM repeat protein
MRVRVFLPLLVAVTLGAPGAAEAAFIHTITPGESLYSIAATDGLSVGQLAAANGLSPSAMLTAGATVQIPPQSSGVSSLTSSGASAPTTAAGDGDGDCDDVGDHDCDADDGFASTSGSTTPASSVRSAGSYVVQPGDTLSAIAARAGVSVASLAAANGLSPSGVLLAGRALRLSGAPATSVTLPQTTSPAYAQPVGAAAQGSPVAPPYPTAQRVSAQQIGQVAASNGVSPSLAQAIAWQESGFNNNAVSSSDARGVMQILPGTWNYIQHSLIPGAPPLAPASAIDNVRGGVVLLRSLLNATGDNPALAAAGYYQGLPSVRKHGLFPDTQRYVQNVMALRQRFGGG